MEMPKKGWNKIQGDWYHSLDQTVHGLPPGVYKMISSSDGKRYFMPATDPSDQSVSLPGLPSEYILDQIRMFWARADRYKKYNLLQKRGILLYGPPGCGKTSIIHLLSQELIKNGGIVFIIQSFTQAADHIANFRTIEPTRPIMTLMEDVEGLFSGDSGPAQIQAALSFLDGQTQVNNVVHVATTNQPEMLADRFIKRPGRFDLVIGVHAPKAETREAYLRHVCNNQIEEPKLQELVAKTEGLGLSYLRELASTLLCLDMDLDETLSRLQTNFKLKSLSKKETKVGFTIGYEQD